MGVARYSSGTAGGRSEPSGAWAGKAMFPAVSRMMQKRLRCQFLISIRYLMSLPLSFVAWAATSVRLARRAPVSVSTRTFGGILQRTTTPVAVRLHKASLKMALTAHKMTQPQREGLTSCFP